MGRARRQLTTGIHVLGFLLFVAVAGILVLWQENRKLNDQLRVRQSALERPPVIIYKERK